MRTIKAGILVAALAAAAFVPSAQAQDVPQTPATGTTGIAVVFVPPYTEQVISLSALRQPCQIGDPGAPATASDPATGTFAPLSAGITVTGCALHGRTEYRQWNLGEVLAPLVGQPAQVIAVFDGDAAASASGSGGTLSAALELRLGDDGIEEGWQTIVRARCSGDGCSGHGRSGPFIFAADLDALPANLYATFRNETHAQDATGHAEATFTGTLSHVLIRPIR